MIMLARKREPHRAHRFAWHRAARPCNAADGDGEIGTTTSKGRSRKRAYDGLAHGAVTAQCRQRHTNVTIFGFVAIADPTSEEPLGTAGQIRQALGEPPSRAGLGRRHGEAGGVQSARESSNVLFHDGGTITDRPEAPQPMTSPAVSPPNKKVNSPA